jgi:hypothetical protein
MVPKPRKGREARRELGEQKRAGCRKRAAEMIEPLEANKNGWGRVFPADDGGIR